jgi:regulator of sirC expression with transglutaminase-like and TPR domain
MQQKNTEAFIAEALSPDPGLGAAALMIARVEYPLLDAGPYLEELDAWGREAAGRVAAARAGAAAGSEAYAEVAAVSDFVFRELGFVGNERQYEDPRNSFLNEVLDRRTGIPITLALVYMEVARRAGVNVSGVNFPGRFLLRSSEYASLIIDPFGGGALLTEARCRELFHGQAGEEAEWHARVLAQATKPQILSRMLLNLKRTYVKMFSFPQARNVVELLLALDPSAVHELRDRGLLAYHLNDFSGALRDLQAYLQRSAPSSKSAEDPGDPGDDVEGARNEHAEIWEHVKTLRRRVATFN